MVSLLICGATTQEYVKLAIDEGIPFEINMADGKTYVVPDKYSVSLLGNTAVIVVENTLPRILPLLTITGINYLDSPHREPQE